MSPRVILLSSQGSVAERSKALDLGSSLSGGVGSNPTTAKPLLCESKEHSLLALCLLLTLQSLYPFLNAFQGAYLGSSAHSECRETSSYVHLVL